jgi:hypothetical protein
MAIDEITISRAEYERQQRLISTLFVLVQMLLDKISLLKGGKSSRTSSTAPSHDLGRSNRKSLRVSSGKKSGGQPGHAGSTLSLSDSPDEIIDHHPYSCEHCETGLEDVISSSFACRQIVDIPPTSPITQISRHFPHSLAPKEQQTPSSYYGVSVGTFFAAELTGYF